MEYTVEFDTLKSHATHTQHFYQHFRFKLLYVAYIIGTVSISPLSCSRPFKLCVCVCARVCVCVCVIRDAVASPARQPGQMTGADVESSQPEQDRKL